MTHLPGEPHTSGEIDAPDKFAATPRQRAAAGFWALNGLFTAAYVLIERVTFVYQLDGLGITLWSPSAGLSVIFLLWAGAAVRALRLRGGP